VQLVGRDPVGEHARPVHPHRTRHARLLTSVPAP
jgi:hypothetical protein